MHSDEIDHRFTYHAPTPTRVVLHEDVRRDCRELAHVLNETLPEGREKSLALTHLQEVMMWANAAIALAPEGTFLQEEA
jgi:hypothetical protein